MNAFSHLHCRTIAIPLHVYCARYDAPRVTLNVRQTRLKGNQETRRMGQPTQRATNYTARSNIDTAHIFLHANGQRPKRAPIRQRSRRRQRRGEPHTEDGLGVLLKRPTVKFVGLHVEYAEQRIKYGILFIFRPFYEYSNHEYEHVPV